MRSQGQVKFLKISSRLQIGVASIIAAALLAWLVATLFMLVSQYSLSLERMALVKKEAAIESSASRVKAYRRSVDEVAADLEKRQQLLETIVTSNLGDEALLTDEQDESTKVVGEAEKTAEKISAVVPEAGALARIEARQLAFAVHLTREADRRAARAAEAIRKFGLNPDQVGRNSVAAQGGPFEALFDTRSPVDQRFEALGRALARMDAMERGLAGIPSSKPVPTSPITSSFGYRRDPFNGRAAMHSGIDFKGSTGQAILSAAQGKVSFAGRKSGYGNCIEVSHGNGLVTRYAHLSSIGVRPGQAVDKGDRLGGMGSTGRSTGTHLHFEVRLNGRAINPRPFLEANSDVLKVQAVATQRTRTDGSDH